MCASSSSIVVSVIILLKNPSNIRLLIVFFFAFGGYNHTGEARGDESLVVGQTSVAVALIEVAAVPACDDIDSESLRLAHRHIAVVFGGASSYD